MVRWSRAIVLSVAATAVLGVGAPASGSAPDGTSRRAADPVSAVPAGQPVGSTRLVDVTPDGAPTSHGSYPSSVSADGRYVGFTSADKLVPGTGRARDVQHAYLADRTSGAITLLDATARGKFGDGEAGAPSVSADGRLVTFTSNAPDLAPGAAPRTWNVYLLDTATGALRLITSGADGEPADGSSFDTEISADGSTIVYRSAARNLLAGRKAPKHSSNVFRCDLATGVTTLVSRSVRGGYPREFGWSDHPSVSADGRLVAYDSTATDIVHGASGFYDVILYDVTTDTSTLVSGTVSGQKPHGQSLDAAISDDGSTVAFSSSASNLLDEPVKGHENNIYLYDVAASAKRLVTRSFDGGYAKGSSVKPDLNADATVLTFESSSPDLVSDDDNRRADVFLQDTATGVTTLISRNGAGNPAHGDSTSPSVSADGAIITYGSTADDLVEETRTAVPRVYAYRAS